MPYACHPRLILKSILVPNMDSVPFQVLIYLGHTAIAFDHEHRQSWVRQVSDIFQLMVVSNPHIHVARSYSA